jgi:HK97 family phage portal protein
MGLWANLTAKKTITAQNAPMVVPDTQGLLTLTSQVAISRNEAMSVPAVARCRNLIAGVISSMELETELKATDEKVPNLPWLNQISKSAPNTVVLSWIVDSLLFYGTAYLEVTEVYQDDNRPARFEYVANNRVLAQLNDNSTFVTEYWVDSKPRPMSGLGSLITIQLGGEGILANGARVLRAAVDLEKAASTAAATPVPSGILKNNGADLPAQEVAGLLAAWKRSRSERSTAYLTSTLEYQATSFSPKDMMYNEAQQYMATQIARLCNVPAYYISADMNNSMTYSNVQDERRQFVSLSLQPFISAIEQRFSMDDLTPNTQYVSFDMDSGFLRANPLERLNVIEKMLNLGLITVEQAQAMEELSPNGNN